MSDQSSKGRAIAVPSGRLGRLTRLGSMSAGVAGNMALNGIAQLGQGQRPSLRNLLLTPRNISRITDELAKMRGAAMKIGQLISMDTGEVLSPELAEIMSRLRADAHFMPPVQLKQVLTENWGEGWIKSFKRFDVRPIAAASIGQVHRAFLRDGRDLAVKVQYPGIAKSIDSDVANVGALIRMSGLLPTGFEIAPYLSEARNQLHEETDYILEGSHLKRFTELLTADDRFEIPSVHPDWTTNSVLAMSFSEGRPIETVIEECQDERDRIGTLLIELLLRELFEFELMQTDPNFANYRYDSASRQVVLLDFGATREIDPEIADLYRAMMRAGLQRDRMEVEAIAQKLGFFDDQTADNHRAQLIAIIETVFEALLAAPKFDFASTDLTEKIERQGTSLAQSGFIPPEVPMDILYLQRKFGGMFLLMAKLGACVPVTRLLEPYLLR